MAGFVSMSRKEASVIVRGHKQNALEPAVEKIFDVLTSAEMTPLEAAAVLTRAWDKVLAKSIISGGSKTKC